MLFWFLKRKITLGRNFSSIKVSVLLSGQQQLISNSFLVLSLLFKKEEILNLKHLHKKLQSDVNLKSLIFGSLWIKPSKTGEKVAEKDSSIYHMELCWQCPKYLQSRFDTQYRRHLADDYKTLIYLKANQHQWYVCCLTDSQCQHLLLAFGKKTFK